MIEAPLSVLLADDDEDDCLIFKEVLHDLSVDSLLTTVNNGEQLMRELNARTERLPDIIFLDLNMPRKAGFECLREIKQDEKLKFVKVIIYSTSFELDVVDLLYENGAQHYIRKPGDYTQLKKVIFKAIKIAGTGHPTKPPRENFIIEV
jgi:CheY-like chemotaxis protein